MNERGLKYIAIVAIPHSCVIFFCLIMIFTKAATPYISGFGVDSTGRVYVGENKGIGIYQERTKIGVIEIQADAYFIDVDENDQIRIVYTSRVDWMDLSGKVVKTMDDPYAQTYSQLNSASNKFVAANGDTYREIAHYGWTRIVKNNSEVVYYQNHLSLLVKLLIQVCAVLMPVSILWAIYYGTREPGKGQEDGSSVSSQVDEIDHN